MVFILTLFLVVFVWQSKDFSNGYLGWLKAGILKNNPFEPDLDLNSLLSQDTGLNFSDKAATEPLEVFSPKQESEELKELEVGQVIIDVKPGLVKPGLTQIEEEVKEIARQVERVDKEIQDLKSLTEIQEQIQELSQKVAELGQEINGLS